MHSLKASSRSDSVQFLACLFSYFCVIATFPQVQFLPGSTLAFGEFSHKPETMAKGPVRCIADIRPSNEFKRARYDEPAAFNPPEESSAHDFFREALGSRPPGLPKSTSSNLIQAGLVELIDGMEDIQAASEEARHRWCPSLDQNTGFFTVPTSLDTFESDDEFGFNPDCFLDYEKFSDCEMSSTPEVEKQKFFSNQGTVNPSPPRTQMESLQHKLAATHDSKQFSTQEVEGSQPLSTNQCTQPISTSTEPHFSNLEPPDSPILNKHAQPIFTVNPKSTHDCMRRFDQEMKKWPDGNCGRWSEPIWFIDMPLALVSFIDKQDKTVTLIRLKATSASTRGQFEFPCHIKGAFSTLVTWVLYDYAAVQSQLERLGHCTQNKEEELLVWLVNELFDPKHGSLPVTGIVRTRVLALDRSAFGPVQTLFIENIYNKKKNIHQTACHIVGFWYKNFDHEAWKVFQEDAKFWSFIREAVASAGDFYQFKNKKEVENQKIGFITFEDFEMFDLELLSSRYLPKVGLQTAQQQFRKAKAHFVNSETEKKLDDIEKEISTNISLYGNMCKSKRKLSSQEFSFHDVLVGMVVIEIKNEDFYLLRLLDISRLPITSRTISRRLHLLQKGLISYLTVFLASLASDEEEMIADAHTKLVSWFFQQLFQPEGSLPICGIIKKDLKKSDQLVFRPFQKYLINCLTQPYSQGMYAQIFTTIVGYWYKSMCTNLWNTQFGIEINYWSFMARALTMYDVPKLGANTKIETALRKLKKASGGHHSH